MFFYDCDVGRVPDNGQNDVTDGNVENYPLDWETEDPGCPCADPCGTGRPEDTDTEMAPADPLETV